MWYREISKPQKQKNEDSENKAIDIESKIGNWVRSQETNKSKSKEFEVFNATCNQYF